MKSKKKSGFTLIEVIVAMALIGILIVPVTMIWSNIKYYNVSARSKVNNAAVAQKVMEYYRRANFNNLAGYDNLRTSPLSDSYYYYFTYNNDAESDTSNPVVDPSSEQLTTKLDTGILSSGADNEKYAVALKKVTSSSSPYNELVKVKFSNKNGMIQIEVNVWSTSSKDSGKIQYIMLRRYNV